MIVIFKNISGPALLSAYNLKILVTKYITKGDYISSTLNMLMK